MRYLIVLLLAGCAAQQSITLLPRGSAERGTGTIDRMRNVLTVDIGGRRYEGTMQMQSATSTSWGLYGPRTTSTTSNQASALLLGAEGQVRCEFGWDGLMTSATGVCQDNRGASYDLLIKN